MNKELIIAAVESLRQNPVAAVESNGANRIVFDNLNDIATDNKRGKSYCGQASGVVFDFLPEFLLATRVDATPLVATASASNGCFHHYNVIVPKAAGAAVICDLTVAQFFTRPLDALGERGYFVGTPAELKTIVQRAQEETWNFIRHTFVEENFEDLWDVDYRLAQDYDLRDRVFKALDRATVCCLATESLAYPWETTWGDKARIIPRGLSNAEIFNVISGHNNLISGTTPPVEGFVTALSIEKIKAGGRRPPRL